MLIEIFILIITVNAIYVIYAVKKTFFSKKTNGKKNNKSISKQKKHTGTHLYQTKKEFFGKKNKNYESIGALFTECEKNFYNSLIKIVPSKYAIFGKVRIADVIEPAKIKHGRERMLLFYKICAKHIDYVICNKKTLQVVCCVELHDSSHNNEERQRRDKFVREVFRGAKIKLIEIKANREYNIKQLKKDFKCVF